ncbi:hypothetical protein [Nocardia rhizosphaerihabitans]|uniref:Uncharacterized protein n=1 Tax=Nocardia rhizosphaerihabitans TaxID=1691570 RepID=A0ABQ2KC98_9NOCA|nr:hypothetical protein [Nocardia rhizosphaerihabitans]GGN79153.1 hypothetical protein GCM10011610_27320 [Nocardia rhizosphaerihabitans]
MTKTWGIAGMFGRFRAVITFTVSERQYRLMSMSSLCSETRLAAYGSVSTSLALLSDHALQRALDAAEPLGSGIGGKSVLLEVAGRQAFVKRVPVIDLELRPENVHSTANLFELPMFCHYGIGGPAMTTNWVLAGEFAGFPLM